MEGVVRGVGEEREGVRDGIGSFWSNGRLMSWSGCARWTE